jgi:DegV family protein with EDD domain
MTLLALTAAETALEAETAEDLKKRVKEIQNRIRQYWALFSLKYLYQTGRISAAKAFIGQMLKLVPMITTDAEGLIIPAGKTRHIVKSFDRIISFVEKDIKKQNGSTIDILVSYTGSEENGIVLKEKIEKYFDVANALFFKGSYCVHRYVGPDAAGLAFYVHP